MSRATPTALLTIAEARRSLTARFRDAELETPELDARALLGGLLRLDLTGLSASQSRTLSPEETAALNAFAARRLAGEPIARIFALREFWSLSFSLSAGTLVPRPDTETLVQAVLDLIGADNRRQPIKFADIGTGSGAILLALLSELPQAYGIGTDISADALQTARVNAIRLGLANQTAFVRCDHAAALDAGFDMIVSNPPYIRSSAIDGLARDVRDHDPRAALDGGPDGLAAYRVIVPQAMDRLKRNGYLALEIGHDQSADVRNLLETAGFEGIEPRTDLSGVVRVVLGRKPAHG